jgi:outer membrane immunogenic protein
VKNSSLAFAAGVAALAVAVIPAGAADLAVAPAYKAPMQAPAYNWTGFYLGVNGGYAWGQQDPLNIFTTKFDTFSINYSGGVVGGTFGAQIQSGHVLMGLEADIDWASISGSMSYVPTIFGAPAPIATINLTTKIDSISTGRVRVGYAADNWLFYGTGGLALVGANTSVATVGGASCTITLLGAPCTGSGRRVGAAAGAGLEYGFTPNMSAKIEYLYVTAVAIEVSHINMVRAGLNFRFGG